MSIMSTFTGDDAGAQLRTAGTAFADSMRALPIGDMVTNVAMGIASAQAKLDSSSIKLLEAYASHTVDMWDPNGDTQQVSMLALGLVPSFFTFNRVNIKIVMELSFHEEQSNQASLSGNLNASGDANSGGDDASPAEGDAAPASGDASASPATSKKSSYAAGASVSVSSARKFAIDMSGLAEVNAEMISVPTPTAVLESITNLLTASAPN